MIEGKYLDDEFVTYLKNNWSNTVARHTYNIYGEDNFGLIKYGNNVYIEPTYNEANIPNYVYDYVKRFCKDNNYKFYGKDV